MPDIISEIVSEDEKARNRVQAVKEEKAQLSSKLRSQRAAIEEKHQNRANDYVQKYKEELNQKMIFQKLLNIQDFYLSITFIQNKITIKF